MSKVPESLAEALAERYALESVIGQGGMATVYRARDLKHRRSVAVKVLRPELAAAIGSERFLKEIEIAAGLNHPHILPLHDSGRAVGRSDGQAAEFLYYVMPVVEGESVRDLLLRRVRLEPHEALSIVKEVADALSYAHRRGLVHRDVKPENILFSEGHAVVADFGIAKAVITAGGEQLTQSGFPLGTPGYMSPEQAAGRTDLDATTDVYGLACVLYEMLVGETPGMWLEAESVRLGRFAEASPEHRALLDRLPGGLERVLVKALAMRPELRHKTPTEFADDVGRSLSAGPRFREQQAKQILERAALIEAGTPTAGDDYALSLGGVQRIGAEAGIRPEHVEEAALGLPEPGEGLVRGDVLGVRSKLDLIHIVDAEISRADYAPLLNEIRSTLGDMGQLEATLDESFAWSSRPGGTGRKAHVVVNPHGVSTRIRISDDDAGPGQAIVLLPLGVGSLVLLGITGAIVTGAGGSDVAGAIVGGAVSLSAFASSFAGLRWLHRRQMRKRFAKLAGLLARLERIVLQRGRRSTPKTLKKDHDIGGGLDG
ncbi:MAG: serine/threonine protein kinase [Gemmatimonadota bacterium]|nr:serine/threonine protein kinase [Gemmatimonadota bacterium]